MPAAVFAGVCTLDLIYLTAEPMGTNNAQRGLDFLATAGGGATNAAITFAALGGDATLITAIGQGPLGDSVRHELTALGVTVHDTTRTTPTAHLLPASSSRSPPATAPSFPGVVAPTRPRSATTRSQPYCFARTCS